VPIALGKSFAPTWDWEYESVNRGYSGPRLANSLYEPAGFAGWRQDTTQMHIEILELGKMETHA